MSTRYQLCSQSSPPPSPPTHCALTLPNQHYATILHPYNTGIMKHITLWELFNQRMNSPRRWRLWRRPWLRLAQSPGATSLVSRLLLAALAARACIGGALIPSLPRALSHSLYSSLSLVVPCNTSATTNTRWALAQARGRDVDAWLQAHIHTHTAPFLRYSLAGERNWLVLRTTLQRRWGRRTTTAFLASGSAWRVFLFLLLTLSHARACGARSSQQRREQAGAAMGARPTRECRAAKMAPACGCACALCARTRGRSDDDAGTARAPAGIVGVL